MQRKNNVEYKLCNGLRQSTESDLAIFKMCMEKSAPMSTLWMDNDDVTKVIQWDNEWEGYLAHRKKVIELDGHERYLPWNAYKELGLNWVDGYGYAQKAGDCVSFGHKNSLKTSNFSNCLRSGRKPKEIAQSVAYAMARGEGRIQFGDGCNLLPMAKIAAEKGNYWTEDFGAYNTGGYCRKYKDDSYMDAHAKKSQSIICFLPSADFDHCFNVCSAGFGINIGSNVFPGGSEVNKDGLGQVSLWDSGAHSTALVAAWTGKSGKRYVYLENSHPTEYTCDDLNDNHQWGCWLDEDDFSKLSCGDVFNYGNWYVNIGELGE